MNFNNSITKYIFSNGTTTKAIKKGLGHRDGALRTEIMNKVIFSSQ